MPALACADEQPMTACGTLRTSRREPAMSVRRGRADVIPSACSFADLSPAAARRGAMLFRRKGWCDLRVPSGGVLIAPCLGVENRIPDCAIGLTARRPP